MDVTLVRIIVPLLAEAATSSSIWFEFFKVLFQGFITAFFGLLFALRLKHVWFDAEKRKKEDNERELILEELKDLERHFNANRIVLATMVERNRARTSLEMPAPMHLRQLQIPEDYFILRKETLHGLHSKYTRHVSRLNVVLRNRNIEAEHLYEVLNQPNVQWRDVQPIMTYMVQSYDRAAFPELKRCRRELGDPTQADFVHPSEEPGYVAPPRELVFNPWPIQAPQPKPDERTMTDPKPVDPDGDFDD